MDNFTIIRKVELSEINKNRTVVGPNVIMTVKFKSKIDLFDNIDKIRDAIRAWKSMHKFLRAKVIQKGDELFFAIDENSAVNRNLENIRFLRVQHRENENKTRASVYDEKLLYQLVFEKEMISQRIDFEERHDILWRMTFVESNVTSQQGFVYDVFWYIHHAIVDGLSAKENMLLLLNLIRKKMVGEQIEQKDFGVYPGTLTLFAREISLLDPDRPEICPAMKPAFVNPSQAKLHSCEILDDLLEKSQMKIDDLELVDLNRDGQTYATLSELIRFSRETSHLKPKKFFIDENLFVKLKQKSKQEKVKLTSVLNTVMVIALFRLYRKHNDDLNEFIIWTTISMRRFRSESEVNQHMLGYCVGAIVESFANEFDNVLNDSEVLAKFWPLARLNDTNLTHLVANDMQKYGMKLKSNYEGDEMFVHSGISNMGVVDVDEVEKDGLFCVEEFFIQNLFPLHHIRILFYNFIFTLKNKICWCPAYNSHFLDHRLIDEFFSLYNDICLKLVSD